MRGGGARDDMGWVKRVGVADWRIVQGVGLRMWINAGVGDCGVGGVESGGNGCGLGDWGPTIRQL